MITAILIGHSWSQATTIKRSGKGLLQQALTKIPKVDKRKRFAVFCDQPIGNWIKATSIEDAIYTRMTYQQKENWSHIQYYDEQLRTIQITRRYLEQGMCIEAMVEDWIAHNDTTEEIIAL